MIDSLAENLFANQPSGAIKSSPGSNLIAFVKVTRSHQRSVFAIKLPVAMHFAI